MMDVLTQNGSDELIVVNNTPVPVVTITPGFSGGTVEALRLWNEYQALENVLLREDDYSYFVRYKNGKYDTVKQFQDKHLADAFAEKMHGVVQRRKKKQAWRKLAVFFNITMPNEVDSPKIEVQQVGEFGVVKVERYTNMTITTFMDSSFRILRAECMVRAVKNGTSFSCVGYGACAADERSTGRAGFTHADHDIVSTAFTRAYNRAISDMVGMGEVSAEEIASPNDLDDGLVVITDDEEAAKVEAKKQAVVPEKQAKDDAILTAERATRFGKYIISRGFKPEVIARWFGKSAVAELTGDMASMATSAIKWVLLQEAAGKTQESLLVLAQLAVERSLMTQEPFDASITHVQAVPSAAQSTDVLDGLE